MKNSKLRLAIILTIAFVPGPVIMLLFLSKISNDYIKNGIAVVVALFWCFVAIYLDIKLLKPKK